MQHQFKFFKVDLQLEEAIFQMPVHQMDVLREYVEMLNDAFRTNLKAETAPNGDTVVKVITVGSSGQSEAYLLLSSLMNFNAKVSKALNAE